MNDLPVNSDYESISKEVAVLWDHNRLSCGWFVRKDFEPKKVSEMLFCLQLLEKHGNRETFVAARRLEECLSRNTKEQSVA